MTIQFAHAGNNVFVSKSPEGLLSPKLPPKIYNVKHSEMTGAYFLSILSDKFPMPEVFGDLASRTDIVMRTFSDRQGKTTGVLLSGEKGSGKSLQASALANAAIAQGLPVIQVGNAFSGTLFNEFIDNIGECMIFMDEFEKIYGGDGEGEGGTQLGLLSLLDNGAGGHKKLVVMTINDLYRVSEFLINRPGRIYYHFQYKGVEEALIRQYCNQKLTHPLTASLIEPIVAVSEMFEAFNFDMLMCLVEELNRFHCTLDEAVGRLNMEPLGDNYYNARSEYKLESLVLPDGTSAELINKDELFDLSRRSNSIYYRITPESIQQSLYINFSHLVKSSKERKVYEVNGCKIGFTRASRALQKSWIELVS